MKQYRLELPANFLQVVLNGLNELPRKFSQPVIAVIEAQVVAQDAAKPALPPVPR